MKSQFAYFIRGNRKTLAVAMLCVLVLKGFSILGMASAMAKHAEATNQYFSVAVLDANCNQDRDANLPKGTHTHHTECCALCSAASRDEASADVTLLGTVIAVLTPQTEARQLPVLYSPQETQLAFSTGLFSDWSATAPPAA